MNFIVIKWLFWLFLQSNQWAIHDNRKRKVPLPEDVIELHLSTRHQLGTVGEGGGKGEVLDADRDGVRDSEQLRRLCGRTAEGKTINQSLPQ